MYKDLIAVCADDSKFNVIHTLSSWLTAQCLIQLIARATINNHVLFFDAPSACFDPNLPSSGKSFTKEYISNKCSQRCLYMKLKYGVSVKILLLVYNLLAYLLHGAESLLRS
jgi:hypothetical protein